MPQPEPAEMPALAPGTRVLVVARVSPDAPAGPYGLALFYVESRQQGSATRDAEQDVEMASSAWQVERHPPQRFELLLADGMPVSVQFSPKTSFLNAQQFEVEESDSSGGEERERRYVGYLPGQALTVAGNWEGNGLLTAHTCYAGTPDDYAAYLARQPWRMLLMGIICSGLAITLLGAGFALRLVRR